MRYKKFILSALWAIAVTAMAHSQAKYVFYFIGDGMGLGHVAATEFYNSQVAKNTTPLLMTTFPYATFCYTHSQSSPITDSAAAGTALACGKKTKNGHVGLSADSTTAYTSIASRLKENGWGVGIVTSVSLDDATPAAFYSHQPSRKMYKEITSDALKSGFQYLAGSGFHSGGKDYFSNELKTMFRNAGYDIVQIADSIECNKGNKLLVIPQKANYHIGHAIDSLMEFSLSEMTAIGINHLNTQSPDKFFMMIEGGNIDYAGHSKDGSTIIKEIINFQDAIQQAYNYYLSHPDETLIVITADHDTSGFTIGHRKGNIDYIDQQRISKYMFGLFCNKLYSEKKSITWSEMKQILADKMGFWSTIPVNEKQTKQLEQLFEQVFKNFSANEEKGLYQTFDKFASTVFEIFAYHAGYDYIIDYHIGSPVPVFAIGQGAENFKGVLDNTHIPELILKACQ